MRFDHRQKREFKPKEQQIKVIQRASPMFMWHGSEWDQKFQMAFFTACEQVKEMRVQNAAQDLSSRARTVVDPSRVRKTKGGQEHAKF